MTTFIIGDSGHAREISELFWGLKGGECVQVPRNREHIIPSGSPSLLGLGIPKFRLAAYVRLCQELDFISLVHPSASISTSSTIGKGTVVMAGSVISTDSTIGQGCLINWNSTIGHDSSIGIGSVVNPNASVSGGVTIGNGVLVGAGAFILEGRTLGDGCVVGAGAVVIQDVSPGDTVVGVPAHTSHIQTNLR